MNMGSLQTYMKQHIQVGFCSLEQVLSIVSHFGLFLLAVFSKVMHFDRILTYPIMH